jgi:ketosteroid isomerase-like protein
VRDLTSTVGDDVASAHSLNRISGALRDGTRSVFWVRWTPCFRKIGDKWRIVHHQVSVPFNPATGRAGLDAGP